MTDPVALPANAAATPTEPPAPAPAPSRALGMIALVLALIPVAVLIAVIVLPLLVSAPDTELGGLLLVALIELVAGPILALLAVILGIVAVRRQRGRGAGIAAIIIGGILLVYSLLGVALQLFAAASAPF